MVNFLVIERTKKSPVGVVNFPDCEGLRVTWPIKKSPVGPVNLSYTKPFKGEEGIGTYTYTVLKDGTHNQRTLLPAIHHPEESTGSV